METILTGNIWKQVSEKARTAKRRLVAVAYVTDCKHLALKQSDVLVCDASERAITAGETSASLLHTLVRRGVELRSRPDLHAKVAVFGRYALVGSCNLSTSSQEGLTELALLTDRAQVVAQTTAFIHRLRETSEEIGDKFLQRILKIRVHSHPHRKRGLRARGPQFGNRVWLVSVHQLPEDSFPEEQPFVAKGEAKAESLVVDKDNTISWIRWTGRGRFRSRAREGDVVVQIWHSLSQKRTTVFAPCPLVLRQDVGRWTRFYLAEPEDCRSLSWTRFEKAAKRQSMPRFSRESTRELNAREVLVIEGMWK